MNLNTVKTERKEKYKCFKCKKTDYIRRFCKTKTVKVLNLEESENNELLTLKKSQKKKF